LPDDPRVCPIAAAPQRLGTIDDPELDELSGLVVGEAGWWAHNDAGDAARLFALDRAGATLATVELADATATDWEDLAIDDAGVLHIADIGDNERVRAEVVVWRVAEPEPTSMRVTGAQALPLRYPDGPHDAEALVLDDDGSVLVVTKEPAGPAALYRSEGAGALARLGWIASDEPITGAAQSADGTRVALRSRSAALVWSRTTEAWADALLDIPCVVALPEGGEAIAWDDGALLSVDEGVSAPLWRIALSNP
jgi:hypothetical protein